MEDWRHVGGHQLGWDLTWLTLLGLWQQELRRWLEVVAGDKHQLLELEELLYVLAERGWTETQTESWLDLRLQQHASPPPPLKPCNLA